MYQSRFLTPLIVVFCITNVDQLGVIKEHA